MHVLDIVHISPDFISALRQLSFGKPLILWRPVLILNFHRLSSSCYWSGSPGFVGQDSYTRSD